MARKKAAAPRPRFEDLLARVEALVKELETGDLGIEDAMAKYEEGLKAVTACRSVLDRAEKRIEILLRNAEGDLEAGPFEPGEEEKPASAPGRRRKPRKDEPPDEEGLLF